MPRKMRRTQFSDKFGYFDNLLIINILRFNLAFSSSNATKNSLTSKFLFRHTFNAANYIFINI